MKDLKWARTYFVDDRFATECTGITIEEVADGSAKCMLKVEPKHCNAMGKPMGGTIFTLADFTFAVAANCGDDIVVSQTLQITFLSAARGSVLSAHAHMVKSGRNTRFYQIDVTDELGTLVAYVTASGFVTGARP